MNRKRKSGDMEAHPLAKRFCETRLKPKNQQDWIWKISGFSYFAKSDSSVLESPKFRIKDNEVDWSLKLTNASHVYYLTVNTSSPVNFEAFVTTAIVTASGEKEKTETHKYKNNGSTLVWIFSMSLVSQWLSDDALTLYFNVEIVEKKTRSGFISLEDEPSDQVTCPLIESMEAMLEDNKFSDVVLDVDNTKFRANKAILSSRSPVLSAMLSTDMLESKTGQVQIPDMDVDVFKAFLRFLYTDKVSFTSVGFTLHLMMAADKYDVQPLKVRCREQLYDNVSHEDMIRVLLVADAIGEKDLARDCLDAIDAEVPLSQFLSYVRQMRSFPSAMEVMERLLMSHSKPDAGQEDTT